MYLYTRYEGFYTKLVTAIVLEIATATATALASLRFASSHFTSPSVTVIVLATAIATVSALASLCFASPHFASSEFLFELFCERCDNAFVSAMTSRSGMWRFSRLLWLFWPTRQAFRELDILHATLGRSAGCRLVYATPSSSGWDHSTQYQHARELTFACACRLRQMVVHRRGLQLQRRQSSWEWDRPH